MDLNCKLLLYLDRRGALVEMENACQYFLKTLSEKTINKFPPFRYLLQVDIMDLFDMFPDLGEFLIKEPMKWKNFCNDVLYACLQSMSNDVYNNIEPAQVAVNLRFKSVSRLVCRPNPRVYKGLVSCQGLLLSVSKPSNYVFHTVWTCKEECEGTEVILQCIPKNPPKCHICRSILFENSGLRRCGEQVTALFDINNIFLSKSFTIVDDLIPELKLGSMYGINSVVVKNLTAVWSIEEIVGLPAPVTTPISKDIKELFAACKGIPWQFIYCLSSSIGVKVCPLNCFMHLKISLIMSLVSVKANALIGASIIHVLVAGYDTGYVGRLMEEAAELADRKVFLGTANTAAPAALIGSSGGVCVMSLPLHVYNQKVTNAILSSVETGEISTEDKRVNLRSAVWAQGLDIKKLTLLNVANIFGYVCRGDCGENNDEIVEFLLQNAVEPPEANREEKEALKDVISYIDIVAGLKVSLDTGAELVLRHYFLVARKEKPRWVTVSSMSALVASCMTSARLCRRSVANTDDAVFAIWLHVSGSPEPRFAPDEYLQTPDSVKKLQKMMESFRDWLEKFSGITDLDFA